MITHFFGTWTLRFNAQPGQPDAIAEQAIVVENEAIAGQYRGTPMPLSQPKTAVRSPRNLTYRGTPYTR